jgi:hypothetical protein
MLIAEDLLLLLTDDQTGRHIVANPGLDLALAGANLVELAQRGRVDLAGKSEQVKAGRIVVRDAAPTGEHLLDETLRRCVDLQGKKPEVVLQALSKTVRKSLIDGLVARGVLRPQEGRLLGVFRITRWPAVESTREDQVRQLVTSALVQGTTPDVRTTALIALLSSVDAAQRVVDHAAYGVDKKTIKNRAKEMREGAWAAGAVVKAIQAVQGAVTAAIVAATVTSAGAAGGS